MHALIVLGFVCLTVLVGPAGWWLGGRSRVVWMPVACGCLAGTVAYPVIAQRPDLLLTWYPSRDFATLDPVWFVPFAVAFLGIAARQVDRLPTRLAVGVLGAFLVMLGVGSTLWVLAGGSVDLRNSVDDEGVVRQTSYYTCGAAASATLCRRFGLEVTEAEMARRTEVVPGCGTTMVKVYWALQDTLGARGRTVRLLHVPDLVPGLVPTPCVADLRLALALNHLVLVREVRADAVVIEDPVDGVVRVPIAEARAMWRGSVVAVDGPLPVSPIETAVERLVRRPVAATHEEPTSPLPVPPNLSSVGSR